MLFMCTQGSVRAFGTLATLGYEEYRAYGTLKAEVFAILNSDAFALAYNYLKILHAFPKVKTSARSVQTTRVVCTNFSRSLYRLQLKFADRYAQAQIYVRRPSKISTTYSRK